MAKRYWFKRDSWATRLPAGRPATWEGWASIVVYIFVLLVVIWESNPGENTTKDLLVRETPTVAFATLVLFAISWFKGERPRWRWPR